MVREGRGAMAPCAGPRSCLPPALTWDLPPGTLSTREVGRSVRKLPTFCG